MITAREQKGIKVLLGSSTVGCVTGSYAFHSLGAAIKKDIFSSQRMPFWHDCRGGDIALACGRRGPMITLKQIEAMHWIVKLGSFERAAAKLNTTQSAISKRVLELEASTGEVLFDRSQRSARLTEKGEHLLMLSRDVLALYERMLDIKNSGEGPARRLRIGVTELSAMTWLPRLVTALRQSFPSLTIEPEVDLSRNLHDRVVEDSIDLIVIPE